MKNKELPTFRHELKYRISQWESELLKKKLALVMQKDVHAKNGMYRIRSLYFDDAEDSAYEEKLSGVSARKKYRIRIYDNSDKLIRLERKRKEDAYIQKTSAPLSREETEMLLHGEYDFLRQREEALCKDFYEELMLKGMKPAVMVDYDREPYVYPYGDVRITFDSHVRAGVLSDDLFDTAIPVVEVMEAGTLILEVKYTQFLPEIIRDLLSIEDSIQLAYSKYTMCRDVRKSYQG